MTSDHVQPKGTDSGTLRWLLQGDPAIRWQTLLHLTDTSTAVVDEERSRVTLEGWGAKLLALQRADGQWGDGVALPFWWTNLYTLVWLRDLGVDPKSDRVTTAIAKVCQLVTWGEWHDYAAFFDGESEPCINGRVLALGAYFEQEVDRVADRLLGEQLDDGGWNCEAERGSVRSSFHTTICVLEGLLAFERAHGVDPAVSESRRRGEEYLLERHLMYGLRSGEEIDPAWSLPTFPPLWHYDVLRALDYLRASGASPDDRAAQGVRQVIRSRNAAGRWTRAISHRDTLYEPMAGVEGRESRWVTLLALRVLNWYGVARRGDRVGFAV